MKFIATLIMSSLTLAAMFHRNRRGRDCAQRVGRAEGW